MPAAPYLDALKYPEQGQSTVALNVQERGVPRLVFILNRPADWAKALEVGSITALMTDSPAALTKYLDARS